MHISEIISMLRFKLDCGTCSSLYCVSPLCDPMAPSPASRLPAKVVPKHNSIEAQLECWHAALSYCIKIRL